MDSPLVLPLSRCTDPVLVGGKAAGLARLLEAGLSVPDGCCVTTHAYQETLETIGFVPGERWRRAVGQSGEKRRQELQDCRNAIGRSELSELVRSVWEGLQRTSDARKR